MRITKISDSFFVIKNFRDYSFNERIEILECFIKKEEMLLFGCYDPEQPETNLEVRNSDRDMWFALYCDGHLGFHDIIAEELTKEQIMDVLYLGNYDNCLKSPETNAKEHLFFKFLADNKEKMDTDMLEKIKEILYTNYSKSYLNNEELNFIKERTRFKNNECVLPNEILENVAPSTIWISLKCRDELLQYIETNDFFTCVVINKNSEFKEYSYALDSFEGDIGFHLGVYEKKRGDFLNNVLCNLQSKFGPIIFEDELNK